MSQMTRTLRTPLIVGERALVSTRLVHDPLLSDLLRESERPDIALNVAGLQLRFTLHVAPLQRC